jgi:bacteriocin-like protein
MKKQLKPQIENVTKSMTQLNVCEKLNDDELMSITGGFIASPRGWDGKVGGVYYYK